MPHTLTEAVTLIMFGLNSLLFGLVGFFLKGWYDRVNRHLDEANSMNEEFASYREIVKVLADDMKEIKEEIKAIREEVREFISKP